MNDQITSTKTFFFIKLNSKKKFVGKINYSYTMIYNQNVKNISLLIQKNKPGHSTIALLNPYLTKKKNSHLKIT